MISLNIPGWGDAAIENVVFDLNGTLAVDGHIPDIIKSDILALSSNLNIYIVTADMYGTVTKTTRDLPIKVIQIKAPNEAEQKKTFIQNLGSSTTIAVGNGANDSLMLQEAKIGIAVIDIEGACFRTLQHADIVVCSMIDALALLLHPTRIIATLRQ